jgi:hypothetical protein
LKVEIPSSFASLKEADDWLARLGKENRKLVLMTNKEFRALPGPSSSVVEKSTV